MGLGSEDYAPSLEILFSSMPASPNSSSTHNAVTLQTPLLPQSHQDLMQEERQAASSPERCETNGPNLEQTMGTVADSLGIETVITISGATFKLFRFHLRDWIALIVLGILLAVLSNISPFHRFVGSTMMADLMYPLEPSTIPLAIVPVIAVGIPLVIFVAFFLYSKEITDLHHASLGLFFAVLITGVISEAMKDAVGRPRPDFFWRCFPDGVAVYNNSTGDVVCHGDFDVVKEGYKSFPSGHTSWSFAGLGFLSLYLAGKLQLFNGRGHVGKVAIVFIPLFGAMLVGLSRVDDYWHHWQDVFAGALIGSVMAVICYHEFFPSVFHENSMGPYSYLQLGNNFKLHFVPWRRRQPSEELHPLQNGDEKDLESIIQ